MQLDNSQAIRRRYDYVYISPHFDDVAASCGGRILNQNQAGKTVLVVTVFSSPASKNTGFNNPALQGMLDYDRRRLEDIEAMRRLGVDFLWLELPEVLFRSQSAWRRYGLTYPDTAANQRLCRQVVKSLKRICRRTQCLEFVLPLGVGQHMDHQIVFQAGLTLQYLQPRSYAVRYYEELPYALFPFLLIYRLKKTGFWRAVTAPATRHTMIRQHVSAKMQTQFMASLPSLGINRNFWRPGLSVLLKCLDTVARYVIQPRDVWGGSHTPVSVVEDISTQIDHKLDVISAYTSQLAGPSFSRPNIKKGLTAYGLTIGMPKGCFGERYWLLK